MTQLNLSEIQEKARQSLAASRCASCDRSGSHTRRDFRDDTIHKNGLQPSTAIIITAQHGQSPQDPLLLKRIPDGPIIDAINEAWCEQQNPSAKPDPTSFCTNGLSANTITPLVVVGTDDDLWQSYLSVKTQPAADGWSFIRARRRGDRRRG